MNELFVKGKIIGLPEMLDGREARAYVQSEILKQCRESGGAGLVCFTLNAPGPIKVNFLMDVAFYTGVEIIAVELGHLQGGSQTENEAPNIMPAKSFVLEHEYGHEAYFPIKNRDVLDVKKLLTQIEETHPLGRLFDIDVLRSDGSKVSRTEIGHNERRCLICDRPVSECAPKRTHSVAELQKKTWEMVYKYIRDGKADSIMISRLAHMAMSLEVATTPKPGLVDLENNGSHNDMNAESFARSADAICGYFGKCFDVGKNATNILETIRPLGILAEEDMRKETGGVNTHAGLIFSLGIISAAIGAAGTFDIEEIFKVAGEIASPTLKEKDAGARKEAASGFPLLRSIAIPSLKKALAKGLDINAAGVWTLLKIIAALDDTNMVKRGGKDVAEEAKQKAAAVAKEFETALDSDYPHEMMKACYDLFIDKVKILDEDFIDKNLSPGGAADILAMAYFIVFAEELTSD